MGARARKHRWAHAAGGVLFGLMLTGVSEHFIPSWYQGTQAWIMHIGTVAGFSIAVYLLLNWLENQIKPNPRGA
jgi:hypothetical protein